MAAPFLDLAEALFGRTHPCLAPPPRPSNPGMPAGISRWRSPAGMGRGRRVERTPPKRVKCFKPIFQIEFQKSPALGSGHRRGG